MPESAFKRRVLFFDVNETRVAQLEAHWNERRPPRRIGLLFAPAAHPAGRPGLRARTDQAGLTKLPCLRPDRIVGADRPR